MNMKAGPEGGITYRMKQLEEKVDRIVLTQEQAARDQKAERKQDRRFQIGAAFTSAGLVISAIAVLGDKI